MDINKKYVVDEHGNPKEVIIPIEDFRKMEELLGWDLDDETIQQLREAERDREKGNKAAYIELDSI
jgi:PHD/YefM family antitoxin component YafN of YafNO toxin-antitoxin module